MALSPLVALVMQAGGEGRSLGEFDLQFGGGIVIVVGHVIRQFRLFLTHGRAAFIVITQHPLDRLRDAHSRWAPGSSS
jgi:hypothetical protein